MRLETKMLGIRCRGIRCRGSEQLLGDPLSSPIYDVTLNPNLTPQPQTLTNLWQPISSLPPSPTYDVTPPLTNLWRHSPPPQPMTSLPPHQPMTSPPPPPSPPRLAIWRAKGVEELENLQVFFVATIPRILIRIITPAVPRILIRLVPIPPPFPFCTLTVWSWPFAPARCHRSTRESILLWTGLV